MSDAGDSLEVAFGWYALRELLGEGLEAAFCYCAGHSGAESGCKVLGGWGWESRGAREVVYSEEDV